MRLMMEFTIPVEKGNSAGDGETDRTFKAVMDILKPEAAYFTLDKGLRAGFFIFEASDPLTMVKAHETLFRSLNAAVNTRPVLNGEELARALAASG